MSTKEGLNISGSNSGVINFGSNYGSMWSGSPPDNAEPGSASSSDSAGRPHEMFVLIVDVEGYSKRSERQKKSIENRLVCYIDAFKHQFKCLDRRPRGDGFILTIASDSPASMMLRRICDCMSNALEDDYSQYKDIIRLRSALGYGTLTRSGQDFSGVVTTEIGDIVESDQLRQKLADTHALGVVGVTSTAWHLANDANPDLFKNQKCSL